MFHQFKNFVSFVMVKFSCWEAADRRCWYNKEDNEDKSWLQHRHQHKILMRPLMLMRKKMLNKIGSHNVRGAKTSYYTQWLYLPRNLGMYNNTRGSGCHLPVSTKSSPLVETPNTCRSVQVGATWQLSTTSSGHMHSQSPGMGGRLISYAGTWDLGMEWWQIR